MMFVREYLDIEKMRLGTRLTLDWPVDPNTLHTLVPQLILQPLIENAIRHGIACSRDGGWLEISTRNRRSTLEIRVRNSIGGKRTAGIGVGLKNTEARLRNLYSDEASFSFVETNDGTAIATIVVPVLGLGIEQSAGNGVNAEASMEVENHARIGRG